VATVITNPVRVSAAGTPAKEIREFFGRVSSATDEVSIALMKSPAGWEEPGQEPEFDEYTVVLKGTLRVRTREGFRDVGADQGVWVERGTWVQYSTPFPGGAEYVAVCLPAFSPERVHRDA
jgi:mannose-6-phosphate isomerase-like protein (cupin superfamily)